MSQICCTCCSNFENTQEVRITNTERAWEPKHELWHLDKSLSNSYKNKHPKAHLLHCLSQNREYIQPLGCHGNQISSAHSFDGEIIWMVTTEKDGKWLQIGKAYMCILNLLQGLSSLHSQFCLHAMNTHQKWHFIYHFLFFFFQGKDDVAANNH